jgi:replicative DNA helicase
MKNETFTIDAIASIEAENSLIGALLLDNGAFDRIGELKSEYFFGNLNRDIFSEIEKQVAKKLSFDVFTVYHGLEDKYELSEIHDLAQYVPSSANIRRYADIVQERYKSRLLMAVSDEINTLALDHTKSINDRIDTAQSQLAKLAESAPKDEWVSAYDGMLQHTLLLEARSEGTITTMPTGLIDLDEYLEGGLSAGELVIVGARPSMGKTALGMTIGLNMASNYSVAMLSMEMSHSEVRDRQTAMLGHVSMSLVKRPNKGLQWDRVMEGVDKAKALNFYVSDQGGLNINQVRAKARNVKRLHGLDVLIVDYIGLMAGLDPRANRNTQIEEISRGLKTLAKELSMSVICLAQLNRKSEERPDQMPQLSDLRDSGAIEQDADVIVFIKRPIMANPEIGDNFKYYAKASVAKNRQGRCGFLNLTYIGENTRFDNWSGEAPQKMTTDKQGGKYGGNF